MQPGPPARGAAGQGAGAAAWVQAEEERWSRAGLPRLSWIWSLCKAGAAPDSAGRGQRAAGRPHPDGGGAAHTVTSAPAEGGAGLGSEPEAASSSAALVRNQRGARPPGPSLRPQDVCGADLALISADGPDGLYVQEACFLPLDVGNFLKNRLFSSRSFRVTAALGGKCRSPRARSLTPRASPPIKVPARGACVNDGCTHSDSSSSPSPETTLGSWWRRSVGLHRRVRTRTHPRGVRPVPAP